MKKWLVPFLLLLPLFLPVERADASICTLDTVPAATLLLPYFEVDLNHPNGKTTLMAIVNAGAEARLAHVVTWTDLGVPTLAFDIYLTGYDVQSLNLRDLLTGNLPQTADAIHDPGNKISPRGRLSQDVSFPDCEGLLPPAPRSEVFLSHLRGAHTGAASPLFNGYCSGVAFGDGIARGYVTVDVARRCSYLSPLDAGYFSSAGEEPVVAYDNVLYGDFMYLDPQNNLSEGNALVAIEAAPEGQFGAGAPTFYHRFVHDSGADRREPLPDRWASRYFSGGAFSGGTELVVWREVPEPAQPFPCGHLPSWYPLYTSKIVTFDEQEHPVVPFFCPFECPPLPLPTPFPAAATRVLVGGTALPVPYYFGWQYFDMETDLFPPQIQLLQSWMGSIHRSLGHFSVGTPATALDNGCVRPDFLVGF